jgi:hypothetical protein
MDVLHRNITEALRIHPPLLLVMRYAKQPFSVTSSKGKTYHVPAVRGAQGLGRPGPRPMLRPRCAGLLAAHCCGWRRRPGGCW